MKKNRERKFSFYSVVCFEAEETDKQVTLRSEVLLCILILIPIEQTPVLKVLH